MIITTIKTRTFVPPQDDILKEIKRTLTRVQERSILVITSKVVSIWQGKCAPTTAYRDKDDVIMQEADRYLPRSYTPGAWCMHTIKNNIFIPSAGVDESNAGGYYILWPDDPQKAARTLWQWARQTYQVKDIGIVISDSHTNPLRRGVVGIALAYYGFRPLNDYRGTADLFGRKLKMTQTNVADGIAAAAVLVMGEGGESTPVAVAHDVPFVHFLARPFSPHKSFSSFVIETKEDMYYPLLSAVPWRKGKKRTPKNRPA